MEQKINFFIIDIEFFNYDSFDYEIFFDFIFGNDIILKG